MEVLLCWTVGRKSLQWVMYGINLFVGPFCILYHKSQPAWTHPSEL
jgi:hypothetical protein